MSEGKIITDDDLIGLDKDEAVKLATDSNVKFRIIQEDDTIYASTCDWKPERFNLIIEDGKVTSVRRG